MFQSFILAQRPSHIIDCTAIILGMVQDKEKKASRWIDTSASTTCCQSSHPVFFPHHSPKMLVSSLNFLMQFTSLAQHFQQTPCFSRYLTAFIIWNVDNHFCSSLRSARASLHPLLTPFTQLHGWWHLLAGYATYLHILSCQRHREEFLGRPYVLENTWLGMRIRRAKSKLR